MKERLAFMVTLWLLVCVPLSDACAQSASAIGDLFKPVIGTAIFSPFVPMKTIAVNDVFMPMGDIAVLKPPKPLELLSASDVEQLNALMAGYAGDPAQRLINSAEGFCYYSNLDPTAKQIYHIIHSVACESVGNGNIGLMTTSTLKRKCACFMPLPPSFWPISTWMCWNRNRVPGTRQIDRFGEQQ